MITVLINLSLFHGRKCSLWLWILCVLEIVFFMVYEKCINILTEQMTMSGDSIWGNINYELSILFTETFGPLYYYYYYFVCINSVVH